MRDLLFKKFFKMFRSSSGRILGSQPKNVEFDSHTERHMEIIINPSETFIPIFENCIETIDKQILNMYADYFEFNSNLFLLSRKLPRPTSVNNTQDLLESLKEKDMAVFEKYSENKTLKSGDILGAAAKHLIHAYIYCKKVLNLITLTISLNGALSLSETDAELFNKVIKNYSQSPEPETK